MLSVLTHSKLEKRKSYHSINFTINARSKSLVLVQVSRILVDCISLFTFIETPIRHCVQLQPGHRQSLWIATEGHHKPHQDIMTSISNSNGFGFKYHLINIKLFIERCLLLLQKQQATW
jgi:hypothetical protein